MILEVLIVILLFLFTFGIIVFVHEFGHFCFSVLTKTKVEEFSLGMGPKIWSQEGKLTTWVIRSIPFGGFCQIEGEENKVDSESSYSNKKYRQKLLILSGGVLMNFLFASLIYYALIGGFNNFAGTFPKLGDIDFIFGKQSEFEVTATAYTDVLDESPAAEAGIKDNGTIKKVGGVSVYTSDDLLKNLKSHKGRQVEVVIAYDNGGIKSEETIYDVTPDKEGKIGVALKKEVGYLVEYQGAEKIFVGFTHAINMVQFQLDAIGKLIGQSVSEKNVAPVAKNVSGPVGIFIGVDLFYRLGGFVGILNLVALLSLGLAVSNFLPFPALDGGHIIFLSIEKIIGREINTKVVNVINGLGFLILMVLMIVVSAKDLFQFGVFDWVKNLF